MLTLTRRRRRRSIYSLSAKGGKVKGYMGLGPEHYAQTCTGCLLRTGRLMAHGGRTFGRRWTFARSGLDARVPDFWRWPVVRSRQTSTRLARARDRRSSGPGRSSGGSSGVGRRVPTGRPVAGASSTDLLLVPRAWCPQLLVHGLPLGSWSCIAYMFEVVAMSHMWKVTVRRGASSPCVQWCLVEVSSYVSLGLGE